MKNRGRRNGHPPGSFERFEYLARSLFAVDKREVEKEKSEYESSRKGDRKPKTGFAAGLRRFAMAALGKEKLRCSFCGKDEDQITYLLAGPNVYICGGCVEICVDIINKTKASGGAAPTPS